MLVQPYNHNVNSRIHLNLTALCLQLCMNLEIVQEPRHKLLLLQSLGETSNHSSAWLHVYATKNILERISHLTSYFLRNLVHIHARTHAHTYRFNPNHPHSHFQIHANV
jgi:hypothetical protein